jgi:pSer/pThr/pTyr-binding forkhead associated (FHA) protein
MPSVAPLIEATTQTGVPLPRTNERERRRAAITAPQLPSGRYLAIEDAGEVVVIEVAEATVHLGRSTAADVMLDHMSVSRRHAVIARRGESHVILDDRSLNGVVVNGARVREAVLRHGDEIRLGDVAIRFLDVP